MLENTNIKQFYPGPILNKTLDITDFLFKDPEQVHITYTYKNENGSLSNRELTYGTEYEVVKVLPSDVAQADAALTASTGKVTLKADLNVTLGERLTIYRESEIVQETQYPRTGPFPAASHEGALDYLTMQNQEQQDQINRSLKVPISTTNFDGALPIPVPARALKINNSGSGFELSEYDPDTALETTKEYMEGAQTAASNALASQNAAALSASSAASSETVATQQANIATAKTVEVTETYNNAMADITTNKEQSMSAINENRISSIEEISNTKITAISDITTAGTEQVANIKQTGFYMQDGKLYYVDANGETKEFKTSSGLELCDIGMALYVDETKGLRRYLNGQIVDINTNTQAFFTRLKEITTLHPSLLCTEEEWQTAKTMSAFGQVGKFVFNYSGEDIVSVRIPAIVNVQGLFDLQNLGMTVGESLPNIDGHIQNVGVQYGNLSYSGVFKNSLDLGRPQNWAMYDPNVNWAKLVNVRFNANGSNGTYQDGAPVQQEAIQYPYFIQIATGSETENNIINEIELNNPYSLFDSKYSDHELNNLSWLKSEGQWNSKAVYPDAYDELLREYNSPDRLATFNKDAFTVVGSPIITDDGVASGFNSNDYVTSKYNLEDGKIYTFVVEGIGGTPRIDRGSYIFSAFYNNGDGDHNLRLITSANTGVVRFALGITTDVHTKFAILNGVKYKIELKTDFKTFVTFTDLLTRYTLTKTGYSIDDQVYEDMVIYYGTERGLSPLTNGSIDLKQFSITVDGVKVFSGAKSMVKLSTETYTDYDFVLNTAEETFRLPLSNNQRFVIETGNGYRIWSDGYCHQWGYANGSGATVSLLKTLKDTKYQINLGGGNSTGWGTAPHSFTYYNLSVSSFQIRMEEASALSGGMNCNWDVYGYLAEGEYTPPKLYFYVGETVQNANLIDAGRIGEQLATKTDMLQASGAGMPSNRYIDLTLGASGSVYTAPANGWFIIQKRTNATTSQYLRIDANNGFSQEENASGPNNNLSLFLPVLKSQQIKVGYNAGGITENFKFIYAEGSK